MNTVVRTTRRFWIGAALGCAFVTWIFIGESALNHAGTISLVLGLFASAGCTASIYRAFTLPVAFSIGEDGLELGRSKRFVPWNDVEEIRVSHHQSGHNLVVRLKSSNGVGARKFITTNANALDELELRLDHRSLGWRRVVSAVEAASGLNAQAVREGAFGQHTRPIAPDRNGR